PRFHNLSSSIFADPNLCPMHRCPRPPTPRSDPKTLPSHTQTGRPLRLIRFVAIGYRKWFLRRAAPAHFTRERHRDVTDDNIAVRVCFSGCQLYAAGRDFEGRARQGPSESIEESNSENSETCFTG